MPRMAALHRRERLGGEGEGEDAFRRLRLAVVVSEQQHARHQRPVNATIGENRVHGFNKDVTVTEEAAAGAADGGGPPATTDATVGRRSTHCEHMAVQALPQGGKGRSVTRASCTTLYSSVTARYPTPAAEMKPPTVGHGGRRSRPPVDTLQSV